MSTEYNGPKSEVGEVAVRAVRKPGGRGGVALHITMPRGTGKQSHTLNVTTTTVNAEDLADALDDVLNRIENGE